MGVNPLLAFLYARLMFVLKMAITVDLIGLLAWKRLEAIHFHAWMVPFIGVARP
jgi:hypothetical protein